MLSKQREIRDFFTLTIIKFRFKVIIPIKSPSNNYITRILQYPYNERIISTFIAIFKELVCKVAEPCDFTGDCCAIFTPTNTGSTAATEKGLSLYCY